MVTFRITRPDGTREAVTDLQTWIAAHNVPITGKIRDVRRYPTLAGLPLLKGYAGPVIAGRGNPFYYQPHPPRFGDAI